MKSYLFSLKLFLEIRRRYTSTILVKWHYIALHKMSTQVFNTQKNVLVQFYDSRLNTWLFYEGFLRRFCPGAMT